MRRRGTSRRRAANDRLSNLDARNSYAGAPNGEISGTQHCHRSIECEFQRHQHIPQKEHDVAESLSGSGWHCALDCRAPSASSRPVMPKPTIIHNVAQGAPIALIRLRRLSLLSALAVLPESHSAAAHPPSARRRDSRSRAPGRCGRHRCEASRAPHGLPAHH